MAFDIEGALKAGYTQTEINDYLGKQHSFDTSAAKKAGYTDAEILDYLEKKDLGIEGKTYGAGESFATNLGRSITSSIRGAAQLAGMDEAVPSATSYDVMGNITGNEPIVGGEPVKISDRRNELEARAMREQNPVSGYGGMIGGIVLDPINLIPVGRVATAAQGAARLGAAGALGGVLEPVYREDSRLLNTLTSATLGAGLGATIGGLVNKYITKPGAEAAEKLAKEAEDLLANPPKPPRPDIETVRAEYDKANPFSTEYSPPPQGYSVVSDIRDGQEGFAQVPTDLINKVASDQTAILGTKVEPQNVTRQMLDELVPNWRTLSNDAAEAFNTRIESVAKAAIDPIKPAIEGAPNVVDSVGQFTPIFNSMDSAVRKTAETQLLDAAKTGDYTGLLKTIKDFTQPYEFGKLPIFKMKNVFDEANPFAEKNLAALRELNLEKNIDAFKLLQTQVDSINTLRAPDVTAVPESEAVRTFLGRNIGEVVPLNYQQAVIPWLDKELQSFQNLDAFYREMIQSGVPEREALTLVRDSATQFLNVTSQVLANRSQAARLLNDKGTVKMFGNMKNLMKMLESGKGADLGLDDAAALVDSISKLKSEAANGVIDINTATAKLARDVAKAPTLGQKVSEVIVNAYTSGIQTAVVNAVTPPVKLMLNGLENILLTITPGSSRFGQFRRSYAAFQGMLDATTEALHFGKAGFIRGAGSDETGVYAGKALGMQPGASAAEKVAGEVVRTLGTRPSVFFDEVAKTFFRKAALYDQYHQLAYSGRFKGREAEVYNALKKIDTKDLRWSENVVGANIKGVGKRELQKIVAYAKEHAKYNTFQSDLGTFGQDLTKLKTGNPIGTLILPFVKTPINILKDAMTYIPGVNLIPGVTSTRFAKTPAGRYIKDANGERIKIPYLSNEQKIARAAMGMGALSILALNSGAGMITGSYPKDPGKRAALQAANIPEYSVKIGNNWIPYGRIEPLATTLGMMVDTIGIIQDRYKMNPNDRSIGGDVSALTNAMANNLANKTFLQGLSGMLQAMNDPERHGSAWVKGFSSLAVPGAVAQFAKAGDPYQRISSGFTEAVQARVPGMRQDLPVRYNLTGTEPAANPAYGVNAFTGIGVRSAEQTPAQKLLMDTGAKYELPNKKIRAVDLTDVQQSQYQELSAKLIDQRLSAIANSPEFKNIPQSLQKKFVEDQMKIGRKQATTLMVNSLIQDPNFVKEMFRKKLTKKGLEDLLLEESSMQ